MDPVTYVTDDVLDVITSHASHTLTSLDIRHATDVTDVGMHHLARRDVMCDDDDTYRGLRVLRLSLNTRITDAGVMSLCASDVHIQHTLQKLKLNGCARLSDACMTHIMSLPHLASLSMAECTLITDAGMSHIIASHASHTLKYICLRGLSHLTDTSLHAISTCDVLRRIDVTACHRMTDIGVAKLLSTCHSMRHVKREQKQQCQNCIM